MRNLLWKEWHEQSWKLGYGCLVLGAMAAIGLHARIVSDSDVIEWVCFVGIALLPILSSTGLLPAERYDGTLESLIALPVSPRKILAAKTVMGILLCAGPMLVAAAASLWVAESREMPDSQMIRLYGESTLSILSLFFWMLALTARLPSEARGAMLATGVSIFWLLASPAMVAPWLTPFSPFAFTWNGFRGFATPRNATVNIFVPPSLIATAMVQLCIAILLWIWTSRQFKNVEDRP